MKDIFLNVLRILSFKGELTEAVMYESGNYATFTIKNEDGKFSVSISRSEVGPNENR